MRNRWLIFLFISVLALSSMGAARNAAGTFRGYVFLDANRNGIFDAGEKGVSGVLITISYEGYQHTYYSGDGDPNPANGTAPGPGSYGPTPLPSGYWTVKLHVPDGYKSTTASELSVFVPEGDAATGADFGIWGSGPITYASGTGVAMGGAAGTGLLPQTGGTSMASTGQLIALLVALVGLLAMLGTPWCVVRVKSVYRRWW